ncbi:MAG: bifunctional DNA-formamidopyrimidine glycosylase/DNA-(apurinic or apyrimidinic site) lyase [Pseudomonadota bacterium]
MPEMPEVEVTRRSFADRIAGAQVLAVRVGAPLRWPLGCGAASLVGRCVGATTRRGKYLWLPLTHDGSTGAATSGGLLLHLGMSGSLAFNDAATLPPSGKHDHFDLVTTRGVLRLTDPRRFGAVVWSPAFDAPPAATLLARLGAEPFDERLTPAHFHAALKARRSAVKAALLAGDIVVGAGNIYACEALFAAGIDPRTRCDRLSRPRAERLLASVRDTLARALDLGGSSLRDFRDAHGMDGAYQLEARVYGRAGLPCGRCGVTLRRIVQGQRSTFFCPGCQKR